MFPIAGGSKRLILAFALLCQLASSGLAYEGHTAVGETGLAIVDFVRQAHDDLGFQGAVLVGRRGEVIAAVGVGQTGEKKSQPIAVDTVFEIASCTKPFTAIAVMKLAEEGKLSLDDPISKHLPGVPEHSQAITVRHLLQQTSGIPRNNSRGAGTDLAAVLPTFLEGGPKSPPGTRHEYWNQGYSLLSEVIAQASGKPYTRYLRDAILKPAGMGSSRFTGQRAPRGATVAVGAATRGADRSALDHPYGAYGFQYRGMGGLVTNLIDLWKWDRALAAGKLLSEESYRQMTTPGDAGYALGWRVRTLESGATVHEHTGSVRGFLASIRRDPADDGCLFVLASSDSSAPFNVVKTSCENLLAGKPPARYEKPKADAELDPDADLLESLIGEYTDSQGRVLTVKRDGPHARALINWHGPITYGYLGLSEGDNLRFATTPAWNASAFAETDAIQVERDGERITGLTLVISQNNKSVRFERQ
ncbi:putative penicillin-binding protein PbpX [Posidoniimonas polymericola]|uniref:Putative penicillin-binding protein PbpX n=1 Tax=Posidoniimonas polymericola TaxID=2528002 RepID=A0A5C5YSU8_9BACT|nr:serine hydrolase domain-containing protein [Posidoniimonas polymericola]TWT78074.1 putative penicillin-binding protein PbpX [Posidoniimonas polymericola]